jgi:glyoxylase-like metal-dependent hydrolase (beta-lactamase superfamily II)
VFLVRGTLIDCGFPRVAGDIDQILRTAGVVRALLTHWHEDHAGNVGLLARYQTPTWIGEETNRLIVQAPRLPLYRWWTWGGVPSVAIPPTDQPTDLEIIPTPGHTADHVAVIDPVTDTVFGGDLFLGVRACTAHASENPYQTLASVRRILDRRPKRYFDSHRGLIRHPIETLSAKADWLTTVIGQVEAGIDRGDSDRAIRQRVLGREESVAMVSFGEMSKRNFVAAVRAYRHRLP